MDSARKDIQVIDLRSPSEFADDHLPGALNVPLLNDIERAVVGTLYKQASPQQAFSQGLEFVVAGVTKLVSQVAAATSWDPAQLDPRERVLQMTSAGFDQFRSGLEAQSSKTPEPEAVVLHCWRGGMRSMSVVALLRELGLERAVCLEGGYKAYRRAVLDELEAWTPPQEVYVLRGLTGVGKTMCLREIERLRPGWTLDLEGAAGHRSSLLGKVGLEPVSQKTFESRLAARLRQGFPDGICIFEGESRKIGDAIMPISLWRALSSGVNLRIQADQDVRVGILREDYMRSERSRSELREQLLQLEPRLNPAQPLVELYDEGEIDQLTRVLLERYYDPLYRHSERGRATAADFETRDPLETAAQIV
ncbi:MAG: tRNA 2-selenouridine(34) synthase MnmH, partial [Planctomycetota bacterium]